VKSEDLFFKAIEASAVDNPNSVVCDLMTLFDKDVVSKLLVTFSGEQIFFPKIESIWASYRNQVIFNTLSAKCDIQTKRFLARQFDVSVDRITRIFYDTKGKASSVKPVTIRKFQGRVYRSKFQKLMKDSRDALFSK
jgi:hypothetical protein